ncbi:DgyrCDS3675 [Dimorphilus gyrociliatus]|uniref:DgyrCDS3675 n=1 Tax=Dimorphilus gyrociliatus TaxID=2664684 RepID=A0A7I8VEI2_9ANNE|nr:DgyrCDS3675 [Dimorphilus gyrociliatus]
MENSESKNNSNVLKEREERKAKAKEEYDNLSEKLNTYISQLDDQKDKEINKLNHEVTSLIAKIKKQENALQDEIEIYFADKKSTLNQLLNDAKKLYEIQDQIFTLQLQSDLTTAMSNLRRECTVLMDKTGVFQKSLAFEQFDIGIFTGNRKPLFDLNDILSSDKDNKSLANSENKSECEQANNMFSTSPDKQPLSKELISTAPRKKKIEKVAKNFEGVKFAGFGSGFTFGNAEPKNSFTFK